MCLLLSLATIQTFHTLHFPWKWLNSNFQRKMFLGRERQKRIVESRRAHTPLLYKQAPEVGSHWTRTSTPWNDEQVQCWLDNSGVIKNGCDGYWGQCPSLGRTIVFSTQLKRLFLSATWLGLHRCYQSRWLKWGILTLLEFSSLGCA